MRSFVVLEVGEDDERYDDKEEPRSNLVGRDYILRVYLTWVLPRSVKGGDVFRYPDKKRRETKPESERH